MQGYRLIGSNTQTCTSHGVWTPEGPRCVAKKQPIANSYVESKIAVDDQQDDSSLQTQISE